MSRPRHSSCLQSILAVLAPLLGANALAQAPSLPPAAIPLEAFTRADEFGGLKISPDGKFVALLGGEQGRSRLRFINLATDTVMGGMQTAEYTKIGTYRWLGPTRLIYTMVHTSPSRAEPWEGTAIFAINRDGSQHRLIYQGGCTTELLRTSYAADLQDFLVADCSLRNVGGLYYDNPDARATISRINAYGFGNQLLWRREKAPLGNSQLLLDHEDRLRFALGTNEEYWPAAGWKPDPAGEWQTFDLEGFRRDGTKAVALSADDRSVWIIGARHDDEFAALYSLDLQARRIAKVYGFDAADVTDAIADFAGGKIVGVRGYAERPIEHWLLPDDPAVQTYEALHRAFPGQRVRVTSASHDGVRVVVLVDSDVNPGDYYLFNTVDRTARFLRAARTWIEPKQMRQKEPISLPARDGLQLHGYLTRPAAAGPQPLLVLPHDGPEGQRAGWGFDPEVQLLASRGYAVLQVNYRGSSGYGASFERAGNGEWGGKIPDDIADATRWAVAQRIARADRICIYGTGYGGYLALMGVARDRDLYRCAVSYGGVYDLSSGLDNRELGRLERLRIERALGTDIAKLRAASPILIAGNIVAPVLLIHGRKDLNADYRQADVMKRALEREHKSVELMTLSREGPAVYDEDSRREVYERILQFLDANLMQPATAAQ